MRRFDAVASALERCSSFADIGCDHGLYTEYMLKNGLCQMAVITDISASCLKKAETLLSDYIARGAVSSLCTDGLKGVDENIDLALIAGMGGMEIIKILTEGFIPKKFVLQPMKDSPAVRKFLLSRGARIDMDVTFFGGGYFYDVIKGSKSGAGGGSVYGDDDIAFGRDNLLYPSAAFLKKIEGEIKKTESYLISARADDVIEGLDRKLNDLKRIKELCLTRSKS